MVQREVVTGMFKGFSDNGKRPHRMCRKQNMMKPFPLRLTLLLTAAMLGCTLLTAGCGEDDDEDETAAAAAAKNAPQQSLSAPESQQPENQQNAQAPQEKPSQPEGFVTLTEPKEQAFTVKMPDGWKNQVALVQVYDQKRPVVTAVKPGGNTFLFLGDPRMPSFAVPTPEFNASIPLANAHPLLKPAPFTPAKPFFTEYLKKKFGKLPDFRIVGTAPNPRMESLARASAKKHGLNAEITAVLIAFDYRDKGKLIRSLINGMTLKNGPVWVADVNGVSTTDNPTQYNDLLLQMAESFHSNPEWQAKQRQLSQQRHEATMAMIQANTAAMTRRHEANMAAIQSSAARHQQRMADLHAAGDARMSAWKEQQAQNDASHEGFLNYIKGENTVVNSSGATFQVEAGQDRYFKNKTNNTFIGTDSAKELEDLRKIWGLNPDDYEAVKIKR